MTALTEYYTCQECKSPMVESSSGSVCPNGHGKLMGKLPLDIKRRNHAIVSLGLRDVSELSGGVFAFSKDGERYQRVPKTKLITRILDAWPSEVPSEETLAIYEGTKIIRLQPLADKNS